jgi:IS5 family transposase
MKPGQRRVLPETTEGRLMDLIETAKAHFLAKVGHRFRIIKCQFEFRKVFGCVPWSGVKAEACDLIGDQ